MSRKLDLSQFRGDDSDEEGAQFVPRKPLELTELKSKTFTHGITKKSKKDLEREAEERKRKEDEEALALVNAEMEEAFQSQSNSRGSGSISMGMRGFGGGRPVGPGGGFVRAGGAPAVFDPPKGPSSMPVIPRGPAAMGFPSSRQPPPRAPSPPRASGPKPKGKRAMDHFLQEIKGNQQMREDRLSKLAKQEGLSVTALAAWEGVPGGRPVAEQETTNLYVSNLPSNMSEETLGQFFAKIGPVATVKIMWPRGEEVNRRTNSLMGFVAFMERKDSERALQEFDGMNWGGNIIHLGWSKVVTIPSKPLYAKKRERSPSPKRHRDDDSKRKYSTRDRSYLRSRSRSPSPRRRKLSEDSRSPPPRRRGRSRSYSSSSSRSRSPSRARSRSRSRSRSYSRSPSPPPKRSLNKDKWLAKISSDNEPLVKAVAERVREHGKGLEEVLKTKEKDNPKFAFLFDQDLAEHHLYKSIVDSRYRFPTPPLDAFDDEGYASIYSSDSAEDSDNKRTAKGKIGRLARKRFESMLRVMSGKRSEIARAMEFAMTRAEAADELAELICQSCKLDSTPVPRKIARLHLVSDILHNAASPLPNVWKYRSAFETRLPPVFAHLAVVYQSLLAYSGNISADVFKQQVEVVLDIWERGLVIAQDVSDFLRGLLDGSRHIETKEEKEARILLEEAEALSAKAVKQQASAAKFKSGGFKSSFKPIAPPVAATADADVDGEPMELEADEPIAQVVQHVADEDLDGEEMDEDLDGEAM